jgi:hypothetical protein
MTIVTNDPLAAADAEAYAESMRRQDRPRQGFSVGKQVWTAVGFGSVIAVVIDAVAGLSRCASDVGEAGTQTDLKPAFAAVAASGGTFFILRSIAAAINAASAVADGIAEAWNDLWSSLDRPDLRSDLPLARCRRARCAGAQAV